MTDKEYKVVVKLLIEELEKCRDEMFAKDEEIERLKNFMDERREIVYRNYIDNLCTEAKIKSNAIKEFAEMLKENATQGFWETDAYIGTEQIDNLVKEMVGENNV